jgi:hypothetical protein
MCEIRALESFIRDHWRLWSANHDYLGLGDHWNTTCPPLWFLGGNRESASPPLVVISLEPLETHHFGLQRDFASQSEEQYLKWQLDFFREFPRLTEQEQNPQRYWSTLHALVAGYAGVTNEFRWEDYLLHCLEIPLVPLHAEAHGNIKHVRDMVRGHLQRRMRIIGQVWPRTVFVALGSAPTSVIADDTTLCGSLDLPVQDAEAQDQFGDRFWEPIEMRKFHAPELENCLLFCRRAPFAQGWSPRHEGRYRLGALIRERRDSISPA